MNWIITIDRGVDIEGLDRRPSPYAQHFPTLKAMALGDSFFLPGETEVSVAGLVWCARKLGIYLQPVSTQEDEIYMAPGVRVFRVEPENQNFELFPAKVKSDGVMHLAERIASAVADDEQDGGCDLSGGVFGPHMTALLVELAGDAPTRAEPEFTLQLDPKDAALNEALEVVEQRIADDQKFRGIDPVLGETVTDDDDFSYWRHDKTGDCIRCKKSSLNAKNIGEWVQQYSRIDKATYDAWEQENEL